MNAERSRAWPLLIALTLVLAAATAEAGFRVPPYVQNPGETGVTLIWFSDEQRPGEVSLETDDATVSAHYRSSPVMAVELEYQEGEEAGVEASLPFKHQVRIEGLEPGGRYLYAVEQEGESAGGGFQTRPAEPGPLRFIAYADCETEPESIGTAVRWSEPRADEPGLRYVVDQERGYRENLRVIAERAPDFVLIAGDLVESGGEQRDWDEFWRLTSPLASTTPIFPALGNHEYWGGPNASRVFQEWEAERAVAKYRSYFDLPPNGMGPHHERYYSVDWGPVTLVVLDLNNGVPQRSDRDTNWFQRAEGEGGFAPSWSPGSLQYRWMEETLKRAQRESVFTFVMFHYSPYSTGPHGFPAGEGDGRDRLSGVPLRALTPLFQRYGVDVVINGHDELYEHSVVPGEQVLPDGTAVDHEIHFFDVGIGGDGLRSPVAGLENPYAVYRAHDHSPEVYDEHGVLVDGGKHYGHMEVNVGPDGDDGWQARLDMVYVFPVTDVEGRVARFERRLYDDSLTLTSTDKNE